MSARRSFFDSGYRVEIDRTVCDAYGTCAELLPELITLDEWGYPIIAAGNVPELLLSDARRAVESCPIVALRLAKVPQPTPESRPEARPESRPDRQVGVPPWPPRPPQQQPRKSMPRKR
jgi:ferredoxin